MRKISTEKIYNDLKSKIMSGHFAAGMRMPRELELAQAYGIARNTLRPVLQNLEKDCLIVRLPRKGTFVANDLTHKVITYFIPCPEFLDARFEIVNHETKSMLNGMMRAAYNAEAKVETIPVSSDNVYGHIDYNYLRFLNSKSLVFISSVWYWPLLPFLNKLGARVVIALNLDGYLKDAATGKQCQKSYVIVLNRRQEIIDMYNQLVKKGCHKIGLINIYLDEEHPFYIGFQQAANLNNQDPTLFLSLTNGKMDFLNDSEKKAAITHFIQNNNLDGVILPYGLFLQKMNYKWNGNGQCQLGILDCPTNDLDGVSASVVGSFDERKICEKATQQFFAEHWLPGVTEINAHVY
ncbi:MAG: winged helix-turn-helix domain-containing protein [Lentisphaeria bacterium]